MSGPPVLAAPADGALARRNPVAKLLAASLVAVVLVLCLDVVTPAVVLAGTLLAVPASGVPAATLLLRCRPLLLTAVAVGLVNAAFGTTRTGEDLLGPFTSGSVATGVAIALRVLAIGLPGVLVLAATDPVDLADSLVQQLRVPSKFAYGALAALRLLPLLGREWDTMAMARRARGIDGGRGPAGRLRLFAGQVLGLLVVAIRRGTRLATAMDARGFDAGLPRSAARLQTVTAADVALVLGCTAVAAGAVVVSAALGTYRPLVGG